MKKQVRAVLLLGAVLLAAPSLQAAVDDLVLGFNLGNGSGPNDYIIDLGNANTAVGVGGTSQVDLSGLFSPSTFNSSYSGGLNSGVSMSVVGGKGASSGRDIYATVLRSGQGTPSLAGSTGPGSLGSTFMANGANDANGMLTGLGLSAGGHASVAQSDPNSFFTWILNTTPPSYLSGTGIDPRATTAGSVLYEDLYRAANNVSGNNFSYLGYFTLDTSANSLTFTPSGFVPVPEPSTYGCIAGAGLLVLMLRRQIKTKQA